jgi:spore coat protein H
MRMKFKNLAPYILIFSIIVISSCRNDQDDPLDDNGDPDGNPAITGITVNSMICPFDAVSGSYFYAVALNEPNNTVISCAGENLNGFSIENKTFLCDATVTFSHFSPGDSFDIIPINSKGKEGKPVKLVLTSLPLVNIRVSGQIVSDPKILCYISVCDPGGKTNGNQRYFPEHRAGIEIRGGLSQNFPKKSYGLEFWKSNSNEEKEDSTKLFGLRDDGDWILDAMYIDYAKMRNRLSTDIWTTINKVPYITKEPGAVNGTRGCFVELFLNNSYQGIYCMTEKVDRKQLNLNRLEGFSFKAYTWSYATEFIHGNTVYNNASETWDGWQLEYQGENYLKAVPTVCWEPLRNFIQFTANASPADFVSLIATKISLDNLVDYLLFTNAIGADDNTGKNTYFSFYGNADNKFFITPWDMDGSWGRKWNGNKIDLREGEFIGVTGVPRGDSRYCRPNAFFLRMITSGPPEFRAKLKSRWKDMKANELSLINLTNRIRVYEDLFIRSGAYNREKAKWPANTTDLQTETAYMLSWIQNRMIQVENYVNGL